MKNQLTNEDRKSLVSYRIERAHSTLAEVEYLLAGGFYSAAVSRLYYACYYITVALLVSQKLEVQTHAGVKSMLSKNFVKTGILEATQAKTYFNLFDLRHNNDYEDYCFCEKATLDKILPQAKQYIATVERIISTSDL